MLNIFFTRRTNILHEIKATVTAKKKSSYVTGRDNPL